MMEAPQVTFNNHTISIIKTMNYYHLQRLHRGLGGMNKRNSSRRETGYSQFNTTHDSYSEI